MTDIDYAEARDEFAERAVLGHAMTAGVPTDVAAIIGPDDFWHPSHKLLAEALWDLTARKQPCDPISLRAEMLRRGTFGQPTDAAWIFEVYQSASVSPTYHAGALRDLAVRRQIQVAGVRAQAQAGNPAVDPYDLAASLAVTTAALAERTDPMRVPLTSLEQFLAGDDDYDWLVPGLLERGDRLLITGGEGSGKSMLSHQIAVCGAAGVHPFTGSHHEPLRVLRIDLENGQRHLRRSLRPMYDHAKVLGRPVRTLHVESRPSGLDLTRPQDETWLRAVCATATPDLLVIGPLYRMHNADMSQEEPARHLTRVLDDLRARHGCALVVETHAPHAQGPGARALRPVGSSLFMRWPEFGYGLRPHQGDDMVMDLVSWRGARDEREWPRQVTRGGRGHWPWIEYDEGRSRLAARYAHLSEETA